MQSTIRKTWGLEWEVVSGDPENLIWKCWIRNPFYDKEKANQQLRIRASNFNYKKALEQQRATETDPERLKELQAEIERLP